MNVEKKDFEGMSLVLKDKKFIFEKKGDQISYKKNGLQSVILDSKKQTALRATISALRGFI